MLNREKIDRTFGSLSAFILIIFIGLAASIFLNLQTFNPCDDAFITFRHARNLAEHFRPSWNLEGKPVLGSTSPAFVFLLGLSSKVSGIHAMDRLSLFLNSIFVFGIVILSFLIVKEFVEDTIPAFLAAILIGFSSLSIYVYSLGFEDAFFTLTLLSALYCLRRGYTKSALVLTSLAPVIRPEGIVLTPVVAVYLLLTRTFRKKFVALFLVIPVLWTLFSVSYYGSPVPQSVLIRKKFGLIYLPKGKEISLFRNFLNLHEGVAWFWKNQARDVIFNNTHAAFAGRGWWFTIRELAAFGGLLMLFLSFRSRIDGRVVYLLYPFLFTIFYGLLGHCSYWYFPSFLTFCLILIFAGWSCGIKRIGHLRFRSLLIVLLFLLFLGANQYSPVWGIPFFHARDPRMFTWENHEFERFQGYRNAAMYLNRVAQTSDTVLTPEVGVFGYFYKGPVIDSVGLCSPEVLPFYPAPTFDTHDSSGKQYGGGTNYLIPTNLVLQLNPRFVVSSQVYVANLMRDDSPFLKKYSLVGEVGRVFKGPLLLFERRSSN